MQWIIYTIDRKCQGILLDILKIKISFILFYESILKLIHFVISFSVLNAPLCSLLFKNTSNTDQLSNYYRPMYFKWLNVFHVRLELINWINSKNSLIILRNSLVAPTGVIML